MADERWAGRRSQLSNDPQGVEGALRAAVRQLDFVLAEQDRAATRILGLAELLMAHAPDAATRLRIEAIMESCAFQDVTGQRLRRVRGLLSRLTSLPAGSVRLEAHPITPPPSTVVERDETISSGEGGLTQAEVDRLLRNEDPLQP